MFLFVQSAVDYSGDLLALRRVERVKTKHLVMSHPGNVLLAVNRD